MSKDLRYFDCCVIASFKAKYQINHSLLLF